jgi:hypothetical protein
MSGRHIPDPSRPTEWALDIRGGRITSRHNLDLPYGVFQREDGSEILFNRNYVPTLQRDANGSNVRPCPPVWVDRRRQSYFWGNEKTAWPNRKLKWDAWARRHGEAALAAFEAGEPLDLFVLDPSPLTKR